MTLPATANSDSSVAAPTRGLWPLAIVMAPWLALAADIALAWGRGWWPASRVEGMLALALVSAIGVCSLAAGTRAGRRWAARRCPQIAALGVSTLIALVTIELALHTIGVGHWREPVNTRPPNLRLVFHPDLQVLPGASPVASYSTNSWGLRGPELPLNETNSRRRLRVLCLGASTTECTYLDDSKTWPALLADALRRAHPNRAIWVAAAAVSGTTTKEHLQFVQQSPLVEQVDLVVVLAGINDLQRELVAARKREMGQSMGPVAGPYLWERLASVRLAVSAWSRATAARRMAAEDPTGANYVRRRERRASAETVTTIPNLQPGLEAYRQRIEQIADTIRQRGAKPVFLSQPVLWSDGLSPAAEKLLWLGYLDANRFLAAPPLRQCMDRYNDCLRDVCQEQQAPWIDLSVMSGRLVYFYDDCHFTEAGAHEVARIVAEGWSDSPGE
ncbi:MAG: SGNH/GDSL hydrolase family protein [Pirellulales bacterium]|nr:SGNH/GDSL hydrolase family protein [Pirellulales bacterium]